MPRNQDVTAKSLELLTLTNIRREHPSDLTYEMKYLSLVYLLLHKIVSFLVLKGISYLSLLSNLDTAECQDTLTRILRNILTKA